MRMTHQQQASGYSENWLHSCVGQAEIVVLRVRFPMATLGVPKSGRHKIMLYDHHDICRRDRKREKTDRLINMISFHELCTPVRREA